VEAIAKGDIDVVEDEEGVGRFESYVIFLILILTDALSNELGL